MTEHGKQHFVPSSYLKAWCDSNKPEKYDPYVWVFSKDGKNSKKRAPENIFHEKDMYTIKCPVLGRDLSLEHGLSQLEGLFCELRKNKLN